ncbi:helix-turn-helix transcriptional regulator [Streptomyces sp. SID3343]|uniref:helix-turn-helix domain-containing protein n=1 Tax=Streptomyces sp. SID3343 TaxID=2690260 RepID=UPI001368C2C0|nr:helix-turn-helix transcriptional regulator [Streptomyces sp. SID3343]MYW06406.1 helix-turn-helix domain-containing protein [Streptomyces sp. SID3343]
MAALEMSPQVARRELGKELRQRRERAGLTAEEVAEEVDSSQSQVTRVESGDRTCSKELFARLLALYEVEGAPRDRLTELLTIARRRQVPWYRKRYGDLLSKNYDRVLGFEEDATHRLDYQAVLLPAHLQTREYAFAVTGSGWAALGPDQIDGLVEIRMARQLRLTGENPLNLDCVITQAALTFHVGGRDAMKQQLGHLLEVTELPNISLRIIPWEGGENGTQNGSFNIFKFADGLDDVAFAESVAGSVLLDQPMDLRRVNRLFTNLAAKALSPEESRDLITNVERELTA